MTRSTRWSIVPASRTTSVRCQPTVALDPHRPRAVDHDLGHVGVGQQRGQRAEAVDAGRHPVGGPGPLGSGEQGSLPGQGPVDDVRIPTRVTGPTQQATVDPLLEGRL